MHPRVFVLIIFTISLLFIKNSISFAQNNNRYDSLRTFGDYAQIANPLIALATSSQEKGVGHFSVIYAESTLVTHGFKLAANQQRWGISKRPTIENKRDRYDGMPSGHTSSAWIAAAYVRAFSEEYKALAVPLYIAAAVTGYSRIKHKEHNLTQVISGAVISEAITYLNKNMNWNTEYRSVKVSASTKGGSLRIVFNF